MDAKQNVAKAIMAGIAISIGCIVFLNCCEYDPKYKVVGAFLFATGLTTVVTFGFNLYTGKICYVIGNNDLLKSIPLMIVGNFIGCLLMGLMFPSDFAEAMCNGKLDQEYLTTLFKGIGCGMLMYIAVDIYKTRGKYIGVILAVPTFILAGFEHSIADMFYFVSAGMFTLEVLVFILIVLAGNAIGGLLLPFLQIFAEDKKEKS